MVTLRLFLMDSETCMQVVVFLIGRYSRYVIVIIFQNILLYFSRGQTLLGSRISQISQGSRRTPSKDDKPEVIQVTAHSNEKPYIDVTSPGVNIPPRLRDRPNSESTPKSSISANNASGLSVQPKVLIPHGKQNGSIVSQNSGSSKYFAILC